MKLLYTDINGVRPIKVWGQGSVSQNPRKRSEQLAQTKFIEGYEGMYLVSDDGEVYSCERVVERERFTGNRKTYSVHRLVTDMRLT